MASETNDEKTESAGEEQPEGGSAKPTLLDRAAQAIGEEDDLERLARAEEAKLQERRKAQQAQKKGGLKAAQSKKLAKIGDKPAIKRPTSIPAGTGDPLLDRTASLTAFLRKHRTRVQVFGGIAVVALIGLLGYRYVQGNKEAQASVLLAEAMAAEQGRIGDPDSDKDRKELRPVFKTTEARREAALEKYRSVSSRYPGGGAALLARVAEGSILLDKREPELALEAFRDVKGSALARADVDVRARTLEGIGFAHELLAEKKPEGRERELDQALTAFRELRDIDTVGYKELGSYHEARVLEAKGDKAKALELLRDLKERISKPEGGRQLKHYLEFAVEDRMRSIDPAAVPPKAPKNPFGGALGEGGFDMNDPRIRELLKQLQQKGGAGGPPPAGH